MLINHKKIIILLLAIIIIIIILPYKKQKNSFAFNQYNNTVVHKCDLGIIPLGSAVYETVDALNYIYQKDREDLQTHLDKLVQDAEELSANLAINPKVCDFNKCKAGGKETIADIGSDVLIYDCVGNNEICNLATQVCFSACRTTECEGDPCMSENIKQALEDFEQDKEDINTDYQSVYDFYHKEDKIITKDIEMNANEQGKSTTTIGYIKRKLQLASALLTPYSGKGERTCMPNESDRELIARGELLQRQTMICKKALKQGLYWPKAWSPFCDKQCKNGRQSKKCLECLSDSKTCSSYNREISFETDVNCAIYVDCGDKCNAESGLDAQCYACLLEKFNNEKNPELSLMDWLCGGSALNYVCCH